MSARQWTLEELDRVHPLAKPWEWAFDAEVGWYARGPRSHTVCVDSRGDVVALFGNESFDPPADVALSVIFASKGMDSLAAKADALMSDAASATAEAVRHGEHGRTELQSSYHGIADGLKDAAAMLRRGMVKP